jgi:hypothetical protein
MHGPLNAKHVDMFLIFCYIILYAGNDFGSSVYAVPSIDVCGCVWNLGH